MSDIQFCLAVVLQFPAQVDDFADDNRRRWLEFMSFGQIGDLSMLPDAFLAWHRTELNQRH